MLLCGSASQRRSRRHTKVRSTGLFTVGSTRSLGKTRRAAGWCPIVFDAPNYSILGELELPLVSKVQLAAFPHSLKVFPSEEEYFASQEEEPHMDSKAFIPFGTFKPRRGLIEPPLSEAIFSGPVLETQTITNKDTGLDFEHALVETLGGQVDVVVHPEAPTGHPLQPGAVMQGTFWLSGLLLK